ncbi:TPA: hypothetical protein QCX06_002139 [Bacillus paranthracis]|nr:hypothetical protein [Bacillus paranthracis]HDR7304536.1 hypothetical protein [Bacillus paranthracis]
MSAYMSQDPEGYAAMNDKTPFTPAVFLLITFVLMGLFWLPALVGMLLKGRRA